MNLPNTDMGPDFRDMIGLLLKHGVEFLLVGGHALGAHGITRATKDIDFLVRANADNAGRLWRALAEFGAPLEHLSPDDFTVPTRVVQFGVEPNRIDFIMSMAGVSFDEAWKNRVSISVFGLDVPVIGRTDLVRNKRQTGRPQDLLDADALERIVD